MYTLSRCRYLIAVIVILMVSLSSVHSYEQGSYFVFDIIESAETTPTKGRLAIPAESLAQAKTKSATALEIKRSEFEIDLGNLSAQNFSRLSLRIGSYGQNRNFHQTH